jgi:hypothetical protein
VVPQAVALQVAELRAAVRPAVVRLAAVKPVAVRPVAVKLAVAVGAADRQVACPTLGAVPLAVVRAVIRLPAVPADIPDGSDDDIVARQLREAAQKETDPELREKLWQEYRDYKKNTG